MNRKQGKNYIFFITDFGGSDAGHTEPLRTTPKPKPQEAYGGRIAHG